MLFEIHKSENKLLNQYSPVPRARSWIAGKDATRRKRPVGARVARAQIYAGLGRE